MQCSGGLKSYGKKRRKRAFVGPEMTIEMTTPMGSVKSEGAGADTSAGEVTETEAVEDSGLFSESRKFHAQLILFLVGIEIMVISAFPFMNVKNKSLEK